MNRPAEAPPLNFVRTGGRPGKMTTTNVIRRLQAIVEHDRRISGFDLRYVSHDDRGGGRWRCLIYFKESPTIEATSGFVQWAIKRAVAEYAKHLEAGDA